jgi:glycogen synthase
MLDSLPHTPAPDLGPIPAMSAAQQPKRRILMVAARYFPFMGGIETHVHEVSTRMAAAGHTVRLITTTPGSKLAPHENVAGVDVIRVPAYPASRDYYFAPGVWAQIADGPWDIVHIQGYHTLVPPLAMIAALRRKLPFVLSFHSGGHSSDSRNSIRDTQHRILAPLARRANHLIGVSEYEADRFSAAMGIARSRFTVVPNGAQLPVPSASPERQVDPQKPLILSIGRLERYKGHHRAIQAMPHLLIQRPGARLRVLGEGPYKPELLALVKSLGLENIVEVAGIPSAQRQDMADTMASAALVVLLSDYEAHPVAITEALALQKRVLATQSSGFLEMIKKGLIAAVPLDCNSQQIADAMLAAMARPQSSIPVRLPNWQDCADQLLGIYSSVLASHKKA